MPGQKQSDATPATYVLVAGYARGGPLIVDIDPHGLIGRYEDVGFHAAGSGSAMAQQAGRCSPTSVMTERDVDHGVMAAARVLDALRITSPRVVGPIDVYRLTPPEAHALSEEELERVRQRVRRWAELESQVLDRLPRS